MESYHTKYGRHIPDVRECNCEVYSRLAKLNFYGISLQGKRNSYRIRIAKSGNTSKLRLMNGGISCGRLEVMYNNKWATVCNPGEAASKRWSIRNADVACRQLNFRGRAFVYDGSAFGQSKEPIWPRDLQCSGNETDLLQCQYSKLQSSCSQQNSVGICCGYNENRGSLAPVPMYQSIRITGGKSAVSGQPQFLYQGRWHSVCPLGWTENDADVFCRELGFVGAKSIEAKIDKVISRAILYYKLNCIGSEDSIMNCRSDLAQNHNLANNCYHPNNPSVAMVTCQKSAGNPLYCDFLNGLCDWNQVQQHHSMNWIWKNKWRKFQTMDDLKSGPYVFVQLDHGYIGDKAVLQSPLLAKYQSTKATILISYYMDVRPAKPALTLLSTKVYYPVENQHDTLWYSYPRTTKRWLYSSIMFTPRFQKFYVSIQVAKGPELSGFIGLSRIEIVGCDIYRNRTLLNQNRKTVNYAIPIFCTAVVIMVLLLAALTHVIKKKSYQRRLTLDLPRPIRKGNGGASCKRISAIASPIKNLHNRNFNTSGETSKI
ncbi:uncharacterized protein TRIADDRAFT_51897 [Trichoplax adhaerens]|uniref:SRCR domain-containing protein n=1 Tax=Trichoplax adhaerens TaxID=10228 RepID=B3RL68_TRIAD|nr:hypothetical protein TRIADDRAFT_51897 [Trichoplax adhaerens]EDV28709.1 hypothetical protein TRIADDRAFT_51897 [Trichoplax adhaerens]|eukprot:XP_002107911.1 hypothetical protein TRIADDRAFT_51897 [Trichoplax adhaerens]